MFFQVLILNFLLPFKEIFYFETTRLHMQYARILNFNVWAYSICERFTSGVLSCGGKYQRRICQRRNLSDIFNSGVIETAFSPAALILNTIFFHTNGKV